MKTGIFQKTIAVIIAIIFTSNQLLFAEPVLPRTVIFINDIHENLEAQRDIEKKLSALVARDGISLVGLEGAFGTVNIDALRTVPPVGSIKKISDYLFREGKMSGAIKALLNPTNRLPIIVGLDDRRHYDFNVAAYQKASQQAASLKKQWQRMRHGVQLQKNRIYGAALLKFDRTREAYQNGSLPLNDFITACGALSDSRFPNLARFRRVVAIEAMLDFKAIEAEKKQLAADLAREGHGFNPASLDGYPTLKFYRAYLTMASPIDGEALFQELSRLEAQTEAALCKTPAEIRLATASRQVFLTGKLIDFTLTREEWNEYQSLASSFKPGELRPFELFYEEADLRDKAMAAQLLSSMKSNNSRRAAMVAGGFHSRGIKERLEKAGVTVTILTPRVSAAGIGKGSAYLTRFNQEKTPLEKLFGGRTLFLARLQLPPSDRAEFTALTLADGFLKGDISNPEAAAAAMMDDGATALTIKKESVGKASGSVTNRATGQTTRFDYTLDPLTAHFHDPHFIGWGTLLLSFSFLCVKYVSPEWLPELSKGLLWIAGVMGAGVSILMPTGFSPGNGTARARLQSPRVFDELREFWDNGVYTDPNRRPFHGVGFELTAKTSTLNIPDAAGGRGERQLIHNLIFKEGTKVTGTALFIKKLPGNVPGQWVLKLDGFNKQGVWQEGFYQFIQGEKLKRIYLAPENYLIEFMRRPDFYRDPSVLPFLENRIKLRIKGDEISLGGFTAITGTDKDVRVTTKKFNDGETVFMRAFFGRNLPGRMPDQWLLKVEGAEMGNFKTSLFYRFDETKQSLRLVLLDPEEYLGAFASDLTLRFDPHVRPLPPEGFRTTVSNKAWFHRSVNTKEVKGVARDFPDGTSVLLQSSFIRTLPTGREPQWILHVSGVNVKGENVTLHYRMTGKGVYLEQIWLTPQEFMVAFARNPANATDRNVRPFPGATFEGEIKNKSVFFGGYTVGGDSKLLAYIVGDVPDGTKVHVTASFEDHLPLELPPQWILRLDWTMPDGEIKEAFLRFNHDKKVRVLEEIETDPIAAVREFLRRGNNALNAEEPLLKGNPGSLYRLKKRDKVSQLLLGSFFKDGEKISLLMNLSSFNTDIPVLVVPVFAKNLPDGGPDRWVLRLSGVTEEGVTIENYRRLDETGGALMSKLDWPPADPAVAKKQLTDFVRENQFDDRNRIPFQGASASLEIPKNGTIHIGTLGARTEAGSTVNIAAGEYKRGSNVMVTTVYASNLPHGMKDQWLLRVEGPAIDGSLLRTYYRFVSEGVHINQIILNPRIDLAYFANQPDLHANPLMRPIKVLSFEAPFRGSNLFVGSYTDETGKTESLVLNSKIFREDSKALFRCFYLPRQPDVPSGCWVVEVTGQNKDGGYEKIFYTFSEKGNLKKIQLDPSTFIARFAGQPGAAQNEMLAPTLEPEFEAEIKNRRLEFGTYRNELVERNQHVFVQPTQLAEGKVRVRTSFETGLPGAEDGWVIHVTGRSITGEIIQVDYRFTGQKTGLDKQEFRPERYIGSFIGDTSNFTNPNIRPFPALSYTDKVDAHSRMYFGAITESGKKVTISGSVSALGSGTEATVEAIFMRNLPGGLPDQWVLRVYGLDKHGGWTEVFFRFSGKANQLMQIHLDPDDYVIAYAKNQTGEADYAATPSATGNYFATTSLDRYVFGTFQDDKNQHQAIRATLGRFPESSDIQITPLNISDAPGAPSRWILRFTSLITGESVYYRYSENGPIIQMDPDLHASGHGDSGNGGGSSSATEGPAESNGEESGIRVLRELIRLARIPTHPAIFDRSAHFAKGNAFEQLVGLYLTLAAANAIEQGRLNLVKDGEARHIRADFFVEDFLKLVEIKWKNDPAAVREAVEKYLLAMDNEKNNQFTPEEDHINLPKETGLDLIVAEKQKELKAMLAGIKDDRVRYQTLEERIDEDGLLTADQKDHFLKAQSAMGKVADSGILSAESKNEALESWEKLLFNLRLADLNADQRLAILEKAVLIIAEGTAVPESFFDENALPKKEVPRYGYYYHNANGQLRYKSYQEVFEESLKRVLVEIYNARNPSDLRTAYDGVVAAWVSLNLTEVAGEIRERRLKKIEKEQARFEKYRDMFDAELDWFRELQAGVKRAWELFLQSGIIYPGEAEAYDADHLDADGYLPFENQNELNRRLEQRNLVQDHLDALDLDVRNIGAPLNGTPLVNGKTGPKRGRTPRNPRAYDASA